MSLKGYKQTTEHKINIGKSNKGKRKPSFTKKHIESLTLGINYQKKL